jgi:hypothetical protein
MLSIPNGRWFIPFSIGLPTLFYYCYYYYFFFDMRVRKIHDFFEERKHFYTSQNMRKLPQKKLQVVCLVVKSIMISELLLHHLVGPWTITLDPTFGSFTLLKSESLFVELVSLVKRV